MRPALGKSCVRELRLTAGAQHELTIDFPLVTLTGTVHHSQTEAPVPNVRVSLSSAQGTGSVIVSTDEAGVFRFSKLRPDAYRLTVGLQHEGSPPVTRLVDVSADSPVRDVRIPYVP